MQAHSIYWPVLAQIAISLWVILLNAKRKNADRKLGNVDPESTINNRAWSLPVVLTSNSLENQFQFPIVFYVLCFMLSDLNAVTVFSFACACFYVVCRWVHAIVHVTSNVIPLRLGSFLLSMAALFVLFIYTIIVMAGIS